MTHSGSLLMDAFKGQRVLVTGGNGFIGTHMVKRLLSVGATVASLDRTKPPLLAGDAAFLVCNLENSKETIEAITSFSPDVLIHLAAFPDSQENHQQFCNVITNNITGTVNVLEGFRECGGRVLVFGDSTKDYGPCDVPYREAMQDDPLSSYAISKSTGWRMCKLYQMLYGFSVVSIRPTLVYGPGQPFNLINFITETVLAGKSEARLMGGSQTRDPLYIDDAIDAYLLAALNGESLQGRVISIGGGQERTVESIACTIIGLMKSNIPVVVDEQEMRHNDMMRSFSDNKEAYELLGWSPWFELETGLLSTIDAIVAANTLSAAEPAYN